MGGEGPTALEVRELCALALACAAIDDGHMAVEFVDEELEALQKRIAEKLGFRLVDHRMELYGVALDRSR